LGIAGGEPMIEIHRLTKTFPNGKGIRDITLSIAEGQALGYLGPNGAGKTTTIRHLMGFLKGDSGTARILGKDCFLETKAIHPHIGYIPGEVALMEDMTGLSFLNFIADLRKLKDRKRMHQLIDRFQLDPASKIRKMSKGMKQKVAIVAAFMHDPEVYILDEPTSGLDPLMQQTFVDLVLEERGRGKTFLLSSHIFAEVERVCDRIAIVRDGELVDVESIDQIQKRNRKRYEVELENAEDATKLQGAGVLVEHNGNRIVIEVPDVNRFIRTLSEIPVRSCFGSINPAGFYRQANTCGGMTEF
jgi:ABC-2 type transport system ATP-binding protein